MNKIFFKIMAAVLVGVCMVSCSSDELDSESIFPTGAVERNAFDNWLVQNFTYPYNVNVTYRLEDIETDIKYTVVPADSAKAAKLTKLVKYMWFDAYDEVCGRDFLKMYSPRTIMLVGSGQYHSEGTIVLGYATGSIKIALLNVNNLTDETLRDIETLNEWYLSTLHHEFTHILNQKVAYDKGFELISQGDYVSGDWYKEANATAYKLGFVRNYAMQEANEDFAETCADYIVYSDTKWNGILNAAGADGKAKILEKVAFIRSYLMSAFGVDLDQLRTTVQRRASEIKTIDLDNL